jgi:hypothetical protein
MNERQKRLIEAYEHLRRYNGIHTKTGFAEAIHYGRTSLSAALNGNVAYLTDKLFKKICTSFPMFNLEYLLTGEGALLKEDVYSPSESEPRFISDDVPHPSIPSWADAFFEIFTKQIKDNEELNRHLKQSISEVNNLRLELQQLISELNKKVKQIH